MKIVFISSGYLPLPATMGGAVENIIMNLIDENEKKENGDFFTIISTYDKKAKEQSQYFQKTNFIYIRTPLIVRMIDKIIFWIFKYIFRKENSHTFRYFIKRLHFLRRSSVILKKNDYDRVVLENHPTQFKTIKWKGNSKKYDGRYIYHCHNEIKSLYGTRLIAEKCKKYICVSEFIANDIQKKIGINKKRTITVRNGIDESKFQKDLSKKEMMDLKKKLQITEKDKIILFAGRLVEGKGVREAIESLNYEKTENVKLLILGSSINKNKVRTKYEVDLSNMVDKNTSRIIFTGFIDYNEIYKYYRIADVFILPSIENDSAPLAVIEALFCGLPLITTDAGGIPEYATDGSAIILKKDSRALAKEIARAIDFVFGDEKLRARMSSIARKNAIELTKENYYKNFMKEIQ